MPILVVGLLKKETKNKMAKFKERREKRKFRKIIRETIRNAFLKETSCKPSAPCGPGYEWNTATCRCTPTTRQEISSPIKEQTVEGCQTAADFGGYASFEQAVNACCAKCTTVTLGDSCYDFCEERCCELEEPCPPPSGGCPSGQSWNEEECHCEYDSLIDNPCQVFAQLGIYSQEVTCEACSDGNPSQYQSNFCGCCSDETNPNLGGPGGPNTDWEGPGKAPLASKKKQMFKKLRESKNLRNIINKEIFKKK